VLVVAGIVTVLLARLMGLTYAFAAGLFTGAVTNTPALASAIGAVNRVDPSQTTAVSVGYGIAYPFSLVAVTLLVALLPKLLRRSVSQAEEAWRTSRAGERPELAKKQSESPTPTWMANAWGPRDAPGKPGEHLAGPA